MAQQAQTASEDAEHHTVDSEANANSNANRAPQTPAAAEPAGTEASASEDEASESLATLREALQQAQAEAETARERALRAAAEAENTRKRADRSIENAHKFALEKFVNDLLPAVDSFERAVDAANAAQAGDGTVQDGTVGAIAEGIELSLKLLGEAMQRQGIEVVDPLGAPFDPKLHEAMSMIESDTAEPNSVIEVFQKGYTVNGRLARPARVIVAREPTPVTESDTPPGAEDASQEDAGESVREGAGESAGESAGEDAR